MQAWAGEGRGAVATCLQNDFTGARLRGQGREEEEKEEKMYYDKSPIQYIRPCHHALHIDMPYT